MAKITKLRKPFRHLNQYDRDRIEALLRSGHEQQEIAVILTVSPSTISREIAKRRRANGLYEAATAEHKARVKRSNSKYQGMKIEQCPKLRALIIAGLTAHRSPDEMAGRMKREQQAPRVGANAIYQRLYSSFGQACCRSLCTERYQKKKQQPRRKRVMIPNRISLKERPQEGEHAEGGLFVSPVKTGTQRSGALICIPSAKLLAGKMAANQKPATMLRAVRQINTRVVIDDLTLDNGIENRHHEHFGLPTYFADPHSPWQKPRAENSIGLLRRWFLPKGTDLRSVSEAQFQQYLNVLNGKHRKSLGYRSADEVAVERGIIRKIPTQSGEA